MSAKKKNHAAWSPRANDDPVCEENEASESYFGGALYHEAQLATSSFCCE